MADPCGSTPHSLNMLKTAPGPWLRARLCKATRCSGAASSPVVATAIILALHGKICQSHLGWRTNSISPRHGLKVMGTCLHPAHSVSESCLFLSQPWGDKKKPQNPPHLALNELIRKLCTPSADSLQGETHQTHLDLK